jgi:2-oxoglutarate dehydrogenase complex dehydrogenase (E1) component-like enzyme
MPRELDPATYGLTIWDLDREFLTGGVGGVRKSTLGDLLGVLRDAYCRTIGVEYMHIQNTEEQRWIQERMEGEIRGHTNGSVWKVQNLQFQFSTQSCLALPMRNSMERCSA